MKTETSALRVSVFIDASNLFFLAKKLEFKIDTDKLRRFFENYGTLVDCIYYTATSSPPDPKQESFFTRLSRTGYSIESKLLKTVSHQDGTDHQKGNFDVEIALDMVAQMDNYDLAILVSGDVDFERPLRLLRSGGKQFKVMSTASFAASEIRKLAGPHFIDVADHRATIEML